MKTEPIFPSLMEHNVYQLLPIYRGVGRIFKYGGGVVF